MKIVLPLLRELNFEGQRGFQKRGKRQPQSRHPQKHSKTKLRSPPEAHPHFGEVLRRGWPKPPPLPPLPETRKFKAQGEDNRRG